MPGELEEIRNLLSEFMFKVISFVEDFKDELENTVVASWKEESKKAKKLVSTHKQQIWSKYNEINPVKSLSNFEQLSLQNQTRQISLQETTVTNTVGVEEKRVLGVAEVKYDALVESSKNILNITRDRSEEDLIEVDDEKIRKYMRELPDLKIDLEKFMADVKEFKEHTVLYKLSPAKGSVYYGVSPRREGCLA